MPPVIPQKLFITGTGTGIGKTLISAILSEALEGDYWKPVQAGISAATDSMRVSSLLSNPVSVIHAEVYRLVLPASPHIAAREENKKIDIQLIADAMPQTSAPLIIEGPGGLMVPLNETGFVSDLILSMNISVVLVSRNMLGSINHSLLTAMACKQLGIPVTGWIFNDHFLDYEAEIVEWSGYPRLASIPYTEDPGKDFVRQQAILLKHQLHNGPC